MIYQRYSCREHGTSDVYFAPRPPAIDAEAFRGLRVLILVHGYNSQQPAVERAYATVRAQLELSFAGVYDAIVGLDWPSSWSPIGYLGATLRADTASGYLVALIGQLQAARSIDIQAHSLGARLVLGALQTSAPVQDVFLLAPAVPADSLNGGKIDARIIVKFERIVVFSSRRDRVLKYAYPVGSLSFKPAMGHAMKGELMEGVHNVDCTDLVASHGGYRTTPACYTRWLSVKMGSQLPEYSRL